jgi:hypothetical protein
MLIEAAGVAAKTPGPLRAFFLRIRGRRGEQIAAGATARKLAVLVWHLLTANQDYAWGRPLLMAQKRRALELGAGLPARRGQRGATHGYNLEERRDQEREIGAQAERAYRTLVAHWRRQRPRRNLAPSTEVRRSLSQRTRPRSLRGMHRMGARTIVDCGANTEDESNPPESMHTERLSSAEENWMPWPDAILRRKPSTTREENHVRDLTVH